MNGTLGRLKEWKRSRLKYLLRQTPSPHQRGLLAEATKVTFLPMEAISGCGMLDLSIIREKEDVSSGYTLFFEGDVLVAKITPCYENGKGAVVRGTLNGVGFGTTELHVLRPNPCIDPRFLYYVSMNPYFRRQGEGAMTGSAGQKRVPEEFIMNYQVLYPPLPIQYSIVNYLDRETKHIDSLIEVKQRLLVILAEKRRVLVNNAVTQGLNPNVSMKDSSISWLHKIPQHWQIMKLKYISMISYGIGDELDKSLTSGTPLISLPNVDIEGNLSLNETELVKLGEAEREKLLLKRGDLLFNWRNGSSQHLAKTAYFNAEGDYTHVGFLLRIRFNLDHFDSRFYQAFINSLRATGFFLYSRAMVNNTFNQTELENLTVVVPPLSEQRIIADYIVKQTRKIDVLRDATQHSINMLKERRSTLISAAVTGQINVSMTDGG